MSNIESVWAGTDCLGHIIERRWIAYTHRGVRLGEYQSQEAAENAIRLAAERGTDRIKETPR